MRRALVLLLVIVLALAAVNVPVALWLVVPQHVRWPGRNVRNEIGPTAATLPLPARPPHDHPWPPAHQWQKDASFGRTRIGTWHVDASNQTTHQMMVEWYGWPLPVLRHAQFWWPQNDPAWAVSAQSDPGLELCWSGVILNPLIVGVPLWAVLMAPFVVRARIRSRRRAVGRCSACGYPLGVSDRCTECGASVSPGLPVPLSSAASPL